jgi:hypothetical protein
VNLTFLGRASENGESPTLYATDRDTFVVQGYTIPESDRTALNLPAGEVVVEVYARLLDFLPGSRQSGGFVPCRPPVVRVRASGNLLIQGPRLVDEAARRTMAIPGHEDAVELPAPTLLGLVQGDQCD